MRRVNITWRRTTPCPEGPCVSVEGSWFPAAKEAMKGNAPVSIDVEGHVRRRPGAVPRPDGRATDGCLYSSRSASGKRATIF